MSLLLVSALVGNHRLDNIEGIKAAHKFASRFFGGLDGPDASTFRHMDFGRFVGGGTNRVDAADLDLLDGPKNAGGLTSAQVVGHETLEAYAASKGNAFADSHDYANKYFGALELPDLSTGSARVDTKAMVILAITVNVPLHRGGGSERITREFVTPIPYVLNKKGQLEPARKISGPLPGNIVAVEKVP